MDSNLMFKIYLLMIINKHLQIYKILSANNPFGVHMLLDKTYNHEFPLYMVQKCINIHLI